MPNKWRTNPTKAQRKITKGIDEEYKKVDKNIKRQEYERIRTWKVPKKASKKILDKGGIVNIDDDKKERFYKIIVYPSTFELVDCIKILSKIDNKKNISGAVIMQFKTGRKQIGKFSSMNEIKFNKLVESLQNSGMVVARSAILTDMSKCKTMKECMVKMKSRVNSEGV